MLGFNDKINTTLNITATTFSAKLISCIDTEFDYLTDLEPNRLKEYLGTIAFNKFELQSAKKQFRRFPVKIKGTFKIEGKILQVDAQIVDYKKSLIFLSGYTIVSLSLMVNHLFFNPSNDEAFFAFGLLTIIGAIKYALAIRKLNEIKDNFKYKIAAFDNA
jgi:hypothetical protein